MRNTKINKNNLIFAIFFILFGVINIYLIISKTYLKFVTPKSAKYIIFIGVVFIVFGIIAISNIKKLSYNISLMSLVIIIIPSSIVFMPNLSMDTANLSTGFMGNLSSSNTSNTGFINNNIYTEPNAKTNNKLSIKDANSISILKKKDLHGLDEKNKTIVINDDEFYDWITLIFANQDKYLNYDITVKGKVFRDPKYMDKNQFVPSRLLMSCCVSDTIPCGLISTYNDASSLKNGDWIIVKGKLILGNYNGQKGPVIDVASITPTTKLDLEYVYPK